MYIRIIYALSEGCIMSEKKKSPIGDVFIIGFALFAMFFGAGNLIFPPYLGMTAGDQ